MALPGPESRIRWKDYQIETPTFQLTPVEKPDFSPYLIHMTGKDSLVHILRGENAPEGIEVPPQHGFIKSSIPTFDYSTNFYNSDVVCFTESPVFALDFFRYRSYGRWRNDQKYGIGFSKASLIRNRGVRPVIYLDTGTNSAVLRLCMKAEQEQTKFSDDEHENEQIKAVLIRYIVMCIYNKYEYFLY